MESVFAQSEKVFTISEFVQDPFDLSGRGENTKRVDGSGHLYAIVKVSSDDPEDKLTDYRFDFGMLNSKMEMVDGELWVYVQKNAKQVTVSREGYKTVHRYDLGYTLESGTVYRMRISVKKEIQKETLVFKVTPAVAGVMITYITLDGKESVFGVTDMSGRVAKSMDLGTYTYSVIAEYYHKSEGRVKLESKNSTHVEEVVLSPNFADVELIAASGADIYVDGQKKGTSSWKGILGPGTYQIEARKKDHKNTSKFVELNDGEKYKFVLDKPVPIVGTLILISSPLGAKVKIDGKEYGVTPLTLDNIIIGTHKIVVTKDKYYSKIKTLQVKEGETYELNFELDPSDQYLKELREAELKAREEAERKAIEMARAEEAAKIAAERKKLYAKQVTGYSSIVNLSYTVKTGHDYLGLDYIGGYRFNNKNFLGIGAGIRYAFTAEALTMTDLNMGASLPGNNYVVPVFVYYRYNFLNGRFSPFLGLSAGANLSTRAVLHLELCDVKYTTIGGFLDPQVGINYRITPKSSLYLSVGFNLYTMSKCIDNTGYSATFKHSLYYSADIHMGFTF
ncbi:MAG: PEGA domain-containing protein [Bacteroidales bacterium]|nr:PEGA domain-containing protein [Bacteroidales bacterium]